MLYFSVAFSRQNDDNEKHERSRRGGVHSMPSPCHRHDNVVSFVHSLAVLAHVFPENEGLQDGQAVRVGPDDDHVLSLVLRLQLAHELASQRADDRRLEQQHAVVSKLANEMRE